MREVRIERTAERDLRRLPAAAFRQILPHLESLAENPRPPGCRKIAGSARDWRIRIGDYRVIYEVDDPANIVSIMRVRHRRDAYRWRPV